MTLVKIFEGTETSRETHVCLVFLLLVSLQSENVPLVVQVTLPPRRARGWIPFSLKAKK